MKKLVIITLLSSFIISCSSESSPGSSIGRGVLAVGTLGMSEISLSERDRKESTIKNLAKDTCLEAGLKEKSPEYIKCFLDIRKAQLNLINNNVTVSHK